MFPSIYVGGNGGLRRRVCYSVSPGNSCLGPCDLRLDLYSTSDTNLSHQNSPRIGFPGFNNNKKLSRHTLIQGETTYSNTGCSIVLIFYHWVKVFVGLSRTTRFVTQSLTPPMASSSSPGRESSTFVTKDSVPCTQKRPVVLNLLGEFLDPSLCSRPSYPRRVKTKEGTGHFR